MLFNELGGVLRNHLKRPSFLLVCLSILLSFSVFSDAFARSAVCGRLERQLASAGSGSGGGSEKYARAARAQAQQLQIARSQARRTNCSGASLFFGGGSSGASCSKINNTIRRMESNLASLQSKAGGGGALRPNRSRILAALDANDCNKRETPQLVAKRNRDVGEQPRSTGLLSVLFGGSKPPKKIETFYDVDSEQKSSGKKQITVVSGGKISAATPAKNTIKNDGPIEYNGDTVRTICVRTCDGYYFPVSFSTNSSRFPADEKSCAAMCPGAETKLYYHRVADQEPEEMISLRKEPYAALPTAFQYRRDGVGAVPGCSCQVAPVTESADASTPSETKSASKWIPYPAFKPGMLDDEETRINRSGGLTAVAINELLEGKLNSQTLASQTNVRVVGPEFLPAQSTVTNLQVPGRLNVQ